MQHIDGKAERKAWPWRPALEIGSQKSPRDDTLLTKAKNAGDLRAALTAVREARDNIELLGRLAGELEERGTTVQVLVASPEWLVLRAAILSALQAYPAARLAVAEAISHAGG